jgi:hypothetical protein
MLLIIIYKIMSIKINFELLRIQKLILQVERIDRTMLV